MKMLKKAAAVAMAAAMSLTLLTACGGGSGTGSAVAIGESYTIETTLIEENGEEPKETQKTYETTNGTWSYIEETYGTERYADLQNIKTGERYKINPVSMKAYKMPALGNAGGDGADRNDTITRGTWTDKDGKIYTTETITVTESDGKAVTTTYYYQDKPEYIKYESTSKYGDYEEVHKVTRYTRTADESKFDISKYTLVENRDDLWN